MTRELLLHIGAPKCGSSALQTMLSAAPTLPGNDGRRWAYAAIRDGRLLNGDDLRARAMKNPRGYMSSSYDLEFSAEHWRRMSEELEGIEADSVILSQEGWRSRFNDIRDRLLPAFGWPARAILYIRPQVAWLNAGWWQWGAWSGRTLDDWIAQVLPNLNWARTTRHFARRSGIERVAVRALPSNIAKDFLETIGADRHTVPPNRIVKWDPLESTCRHASLSIL